MYAHKLAAGSRDCSRVPNLVEKLIIYLVCLCTGLAPSLAFAIDPIVPAFTLPSASAGSAAANLARAAGAGAAAAGTSAAAAAAALGAFGLGYCAASFVFSTGGCGTGGGLGGLGGALGAAGITQNPDNGDLEKLVNPPNDVCGYFYQQPESYTKDHICVVVPHPSTPNWMCAQKVNIKSNFKLIINCKGSLPPYKRPPTEEEMGDALGGPNATPDTKAKAAAAAGAAAHALAGGATPKAAAQAAAAAAEKATPENPVCTTGNHLNPKTGACGALAGDAAPAEPVTCAAPLIFNATTNGCSLPDAKTCAAGAVYDFVSKKCLAVDNTVKENNGTGVPAKDFEIPAFCDWAKPVCTAIEWLTEEPVSSSANDPKNKVPIDDIGVLNSRSPIPNHNPDEVRVSWSAYCPSDIPISFTLLGKTSNFGFKYKPICDFMTSLKPFVVAAGYLSGAYIIGGLGRGGNDG
jgi:hypothetical protein